MTGLSLGLIETIGLAAAIEAADTCVKSANVTLVGYELTKGSGMTVVKIEGNVGAVKAAIEAARMSSGKVNKVVSTKIIPRPSTQIDLMIKNSDTVGLEKKEESAELIQEETVKEEESIQEEVINEEEPILKELIQEEILEEDPTHEEIVVSIADDVHERYTCNICKDPKCPRQKGELRNICIHYKK